MTNAENCVWKTRDNPFRAGSLSVHGSKSQEQWLHGLRKRHYVPYRNWDKSRVCTCRKIGKGWKEDFLILLQQQEIRSK
jgi:hypothetical protein